MRYYGALEAGGTKMVMAVWTEDGTMTKRVSIPTRSPAETVPEMIAYFSQQSIVSLGIGNFGPLDLDPSSPTYGSVTMTPKLAWRGYPVLREFEKALGIPVTTFKNRLYRARRALRKSLDREVMFE